MRWDQDAEGLYVFRTLIVDDEPIARQVLREELDGFSDIATIGEAENGKMAVDLRPVP
jgi:YesN/AraC family two-component response regulator